METAYVIITAGIAVRSMFIQHHCRLDKHASKKVVGESTQGAGLYKDPELISPYVNEY